MADEPLDAAGEEQDSVLEQVCTPVGFGRELTALRTRSGLSNRKAARLAALPHTTTHDWSSGNHLPSDDEQVAGLMRFLRACGVTDPARLGRWRQAVERARRPAGRKPAGDAPYRGLASFGEADARWFFGREEIAERLAGLLSEEADFHDLPLVLVGPSGAGKSSLLRAGLLPRLTRPAVVFEPSGDPLRQLKAALAGLQGAGGAQRPAVIIDQFEALFTQPHEEAERRAFISELCELAGGRAAHVAVALRADFYDHAIRYAELAAALQYRQVVLGPMTAREVSRAITEPARLARLEVDDGLVQLLLDDLAPEGAPQQQDGAYEAGALPLLSHAMLATWENSHGGTLTVAGYLASGRIRDAVARTAEAAYNGLTEAEQHLARRLFLRLVHVASDAPPTRAAVALSELRDWEDGGGADPDRVLSVFVGERMITVDAETAQITHDALITAWPRLRSWIDAGQAGLITRRRITEAARAWQDAGRDDTWLWRGSQLAIATDWAAEPGNQGALTKLAGEFVAVSTRAERARQIADRHRTRGLQGLVALLTALVVAVGLIAGYAFSQRHDAVVAGDDAVSRQLAVEAGQLRGTDPAIAAQLSVAAYRVAHTPQATAALLESSGAPTGARIMDSDGIVQWVTVNPDHTLMAAAGADGTLKLWNVADPGRPVLAGTLLRPDNDHPLYVAKFSPDARLLAAAGAGGVVKLWDVSDPAHPAPLPSLTGPASTIYSIAFSADGRGIAAGSADDHAWLWHVANPDRPAGTGQPLTGATGAVNSVAFGLAGRVLAAGSADGDVRLYDLAAPGKPALAARLSGPGDVISGVSFSVRGELAASSHDARVWLWKASIGTITRTVQAATGTLGKPKTRTVTTTGVRVIRDGSLSGAANWVNAVSFGPDGSMVAAGTADGSVLAWKLATHKLAVKIPAPQPVTSVAWDGSGRIAASDADGTATVWTVPAPALLAGNSSTIVAYRPDGKAVAVGGSNVELWDAASHALIATRPQADGGTVNALSFSPDGRLLAAAYSDGTAQILNGGTLAPVSAAFTASGTGYAETVAFSPDGKTLATGGDDGTVRLWSVANANRPVPLSRVKDTGNQVYTVEFAPDGTTLAAASTDDYTTLWDVASPAAPRRYPERLGGLHSYAIALAFTPGSRLLAVGSADKTVHLWNVADPGHPVPAGAPLTGPSGYVWAAAISPDGTTLAAGSTDGTVWLWNIADPADPTLIGRLAGPADHVYSVAFNPAGTRLTATSYDGTVFTWDTSPAAARSLVCSSLGQPLTATEWPAYAPGVAYQAPCSAGLLRHYDEVPGKKLRAVPRN